MKGCGSMEENQELGAELNFFYKSSREAVF